MARLFIGTFASQLEQTKLSKLPADNRHLDALWQRKVRWVKPEKLHMTWLFLGEIDYSLSSNIGKSLRRLIDRANLPQSEFSISFDRPEVWPTSRKPRQIVLTPSHEPESVKTLSRIIRLGLLEYYTEQSEREQNRVFRPHLTLLRVDRRNVKEDERRSAYKSPEKKVECGEVKGLSDAMPVLMTLDRVCLIQSHLGSEAEGYEILESVFLPHGTKTQGR